MTTGAEVALVEELRGCFLFEALTDDQLNWLAGHGTVETYDAGAEVYRQGQQADSFFVLLEGEIQLAKLLDGTEVALNRADRPGAYAGATRAFITASANESYVSSLRTLSRSRLFRIAAEDFAWALKTWFPMAVHLLDGMFLGLTNIEAAVGQRDKLIALGALSAGLAHELNNPAAAQVRAADALSGRLVEARKTMVEMSPGLTDNQMAKLLDLLIGAADRARHAPSRTALEVGDLEDALAERLQRLGVTNPWDLAPALVAAGLDEEWVDKVVACTGDASPSALRWVALGLDIDSLVGEIRSSAGRISELVAAMKGYTHIDAGPFAAVDVHDGLESTLVILSHKLKGGVGVMRDYDRTIPKIEARAGELNQVWTNLIDNAVGAMGGVGTLTLRTRRDGEWVDVEVGDTGPGVPPELRRRIFEPFFTTKEVGQGTGLGLDISFRIVARRHHGDLSVESVPGDTRFRVRLPIKQPNKPE